MKTHRTTSVLLMFAMAGYSSANSNTASRKETTEIIAKDKVWEKNEWIAFMQATSKKDLVELAITHNAIKPNTPGISPKGEVLDAEMAINYNSGREAIISSMEWNIVHSYRRNDEQIRTWLRTSGDDINYNKIVNRACYWAGVDGKKYGNNISTFDAERALVEKLLSDRWNKLTSEQRAAVIRDTPALNKLTDNQKAAITAGTGGALIATISSTAALTGFAFYTTTSSFLCASAGALGMTLPFGAYIGTSSTIAVLSGPIGWSIAALGVGAGAFMYFNDGKSEAVIKMVIATHLAKVRMQNQQQPIAQ